MTDKMPLARNVDYFTETGAAVLVAKIKEFWRARGLYPDVWAQKSLVVTSGIERFTWEVRSGIRVAGAWTGKYGIKV